MKFGVLIPHKEFRDLNDVAQTGWIDLRIVMATGEVPADLEGSEGNFNAIEDPSSIIGKPDDVFASLRAEKMYKEHAAAKADAAKQSPGGEGDA